MEFNLFLWPIIMPMLIPLFYCAKYKRKYLADVATITLSMVIIVVLYWPLATSLGSIASIAVKILLFVILPIMCLLFLKRDKSPLNLKQYGIKKDGLKKSLWLCVLFLPIMLVVTFSIKYINGMASDTDILFGTVSFFESFTEEFFFRGILFIFLLGRTDIKIAYITSLASFVLMHPQHFTDIFIVSTIVQGTLTIEITRRSGNITGAWVLHGINRFFIIAVIPFLLFI